MDDSEKLANDYLSRLGYRDIVYEPDNKNPPDFVVDGRIAVEVRRLNQNEVTESGFRGLEVTAIPLLMKIQKLLASLGPAKSGASWFVSYNFRRPFPPRHEILPELRRQLEIFRDNSENHSPSQIVVDDWLEVELRRAGDTYPTFFLLGSSCDEDTGGFTLELTQNNLRLCIQEKTRKIARVRHKYPEWWLVLVDRIGYGVQACDRELYREHLKVKHDWDKVIILSPIDPSSAFEVPSERQMPPSGAKIEDEEPV